MDTTRHPTTTGPDWAEAICRQIDPDLWFPEKGGSTREAKAICATCSLQGPCLEYALRTDERFGIWGGASERDRRKMRAAHRRESA